MGDEQVVGRGLKPGSRNEEDSRFRGDHVLLHGSRSAFCYNWCEIVDVHTRFACLEATLKAGKSFEDETDTRKPFRRCTASDTTLCRYRIKPWDTIPLRSSYLHVRMRRRPVECFEFASVRRKIVQIVHGSFALHE